MNTEPTILDIEDAAKRLAGVAFRTPLLENSLLNDRLGGRLLLKAEPLQRAGSFKFRGAYNRISRLDAATKRRGVVAYSSGNHAQGVACAAQLLGVPALILMPKDAPAVKIANTNAYGAEVMLFDRAKDDREAMSRRVAAERGATIVPPYDDPFIIAGQGTVGLEIAEDLTARDVRPDAVIAPCGGGGLVSGIATALAAKLPGIPVYSAEPAGFDDTARSLVAGTRQTNIPGATSFCDALLAPMPGEITFPINKRRLAGGLAVTDAEVARAMATAFAYLKLVIEPGGAAALAAALAEKLPIKGRTVVVVASGGSVDAGTFAQALAHAA